MGSVRVVPFTDAFDILEVRYRGAVRHYYVARETTFFVAAFCIRFATDIDFMRCTDLILQVSSFVRFRDVDCKNIVADYIELTYGIDVRKA